LYFVNVSHAEGRTQIRKLQNCFENSNATCEEGTDIDEKTVEGTF
jgi:hypothetical protein